MHLFKRVLLSLFPDEMMVDNINPASMFVSFISTKEFFSVINRKIIENYKLNLFDIAIDPFEFKIGFGENKGVNKKDIDFYYGYCSIANMNGYRFFNPSNIGNGISLLVSIYLKKAFDKYPDRCFLNFIFAIYLLNFVFSARLKVFPYDNKQDNYNRFIEVLFDFYEIVSFQTSNQVDKKILKEIKTDVLGEIDILFLLFEHYKLLNGMFEGSKKNEKDFYKRIFYDELKDTKLKSIVSNFIDQKEKFIYKAKFSIIENKIVQCVFPADILLKYIFVDSDISSAINNIVSKIYDKNILDEKVQRFRKNQGNLQDIYMYITDYRNFKKTFFKGVQKYMVNAFSDEDGAMGNSFGEGIDDMMSDIGDDPENLKNLKIPERIKRESKIMERVLNFYITLIGGFWIARGDNLYIRLLKKGLLDEGLPNDSWIDGKKNTTHYYGSLLYNYGKNVFYYKNVSDNVRAGKQKFFLPYKNSSKNIYTNMHMIRMFDENALLGFLQWINPKDIRLYVNNKQILDQFKKMFSKNISDLAQKDKNSLLDYLYQSKMQKILDKNQLNETLKKYLDEDDISHIKDAMYSLDFWVYYKFLDELEDIGLKNDYSNINILGIISTAMETLFGFLLYITCLKKNKNKNLEELYDAYVIDVLNVGKIYNMPLKNSIKKLCLELEQILNLWLELDDNSAFLKIAITNRNGFIKGKEDIYKAISGEDVLWLRGFLKNITYYNKRYLIPK